MKAVDWASVAAAAELFAVSLEHVGCDDPSISTERFVEELSCDMRWSHALFLHEYMAQGQRWYFGDEEQAAEYDRKAQALLEGVKRTPRFRGACCERWTHPLHFNFNSVFFPEAYSGRLWEHRVPLVDFLERHHEELRAELLPLLQVPRSEWTAYAPGAVTAEHLASAEGWYMLQVVRHGVWNEILCAAAPRTCELLAGRPEIANCTVSHVTVMRLSPGGIVKPHFGNAPRLAAHLTL